MEITQFELSQLMWDQVRSYYRIKKHVHLPEWEKAGALRGITIGSVQRLIRNPNMGPEVCFGNWYAWSIQNGWTWGPRLIIRPGMLTNPRLKPWDELSSIEQGTTDLIVSVFRQFKRYIPAIDVARALQRPAGGVVNHFNGPVDRVLNLDIG